MSHNFSSRRTIFNVGAFTASGIGLLIMYTVMVNNRPYWWRPCQLIQISVEDATGLKSKAPIRSLGIDIGYLKSVMLSESHVTLGICVTAPVEVLPETKGYIRGQGFLGDKFVELKPVKYVGPVPESLNESKAPTSSKFAQVAGRWVAQLLSYLVEDANAATSSDYDADAAQADDPIKEEIGTFADHTAAPKYRKHGKGRQVPVGNDAEDVQQLVGRVDALVQQMSSLTGNLKQSINPEELRRTMKQLNQTLENASKTLAPEGGLNQTAQRSLAKLEDAIEQMRDLMTRVNKGEGSVGMLLNDPTYADEIREAIKNVNRLLNKVSGIRFVMDLGASPLTIYNGTRGFLNIGIWPKEDRYYLLGFSSDPRGRLTNRTTTTTVGSLTQVTQTLEQETTGILLTGMIGKVFWKRLDLSVGALYNDGAVSVALNLGPNGNEEMFVIRNDVYSRSSGGSIDDRLTLMVKPFSGALSSVYARVGVESFSGYQGSIPLFYGAGLRFDDEDIKLLFSLM